MINPENIEKITKSFAINHKQERTFNCLCHTIIAKRNNAIYCYEYFKRYKQKKAFQRALHFASKEFPCCLTDSEFDYNIFNRSNFRCIFYSLVGNNISRIDNLEKVMFVLFPDDLIRYSDQKVFSFDALCKDFQNTKITDALIPLFGKYSGLKNIQTLRNQMAHASMDDILKNDGLLHDEDTFEVNPSFTLSGNKEDIINFSERLNGLLFDIENTLFNCLLTHGKIGLNNPM